MGSDTTTRRRVSATSCSRATPAYPVSSVMTKRRVDTWHQANWVLGGLPASDLHAEAISQHLRHPVELISG